MALANTLKARGMSNPYAALHGFVSRPIFTLLVYIAVLAIVFRRLLDADAIVDGSDIVISFYYYRSLLWRGLAEGALPLWNPYIFSGTPFFPSGALFYPLNWLFGILPANLGVHLEIYIHYLLAALGAHFLGHRLGLGRIACFTCGFAFALSGISAIRIFAGHLPQLDTRPWFPIMLGAFFALLDDGRTRWLLLGAAAIGMQILAGHLQIAFYYLMSLALIALFAGKYPDLLKRLGLFSKMISLGMALSLVQLIPMFMWRAGAARLTSYDFATMMSPPPKALWGAFVPHFFGDGKTSPFVGPTGHYPWTIDVYFGVVVFSLAVAAFLKNVKKTTAAEQGSGSPTGHTRLFGALFFVAIVLSLGKYTPVYYIFYNFVPMFSSFREPSRALVIAELAVAVLAAMGLHRIERDIQSTRSIAAIGAFGLSGIALVGFTILQLGLISDTALKSLLLGAAVTESFPVKVIHNYLATTLILVSCLCFVLGLCISAFRIRSVKNWPAIAICLLIAAEWFLFSDRFVTTRPLPMVQWEQPVLAVFRHTGVEPFRVIDSRATERLNIGVLHAISSPNGFDGSISMRYNRFTNAVVDNPPGRYTPFLGIDRESRLLDLLNVRYFVDANDGKPLSDGLHIVKSGSGFRVLERERLLGAVRLVHAAYYAKDEEKALNDLLQGLVDSVRVVLLHDPNAIQLNGTKLLTSTESAALTVYEPNRITVKAKVVSPAYLVLSEIYDDGWSVDVDGVSTDLLRVDYLLRGVYLDPGNHEISFNYCPPGLFEGIAGTCFAIFICVALLVRKSRID